MPAQSPVHGSESVWSYPRPPAVESCRREVRIELAGAELARSRAALRVLETSHPPTIYLPQRDARTELLFDSDARPTFCEFKGVANYLDARVGDRLVRTVAWTYREPTPGYEALAGHIAFYPGRVDAAWLDDERVKAQAGDFYGGWITNEVQGPFKGAPGTSGW